MSVITYESNNTLVIGQVQHYYFYQSINQSIIHSNNNEYRSLPTLTNKSIIPSTPRQRSNKAPTNSPLSFIREQKLPTITTKENEPNQKLLNKHLSSLSSSMPKSSSSIDLFKLSTSSTLSLSSFKIKNKRKRKVSFDENVMVICTHFEDDDHSHYHPMLEEKEEDNNEEEEEEEKDTYHSLNHDSGNHMIYKNDFFYHGRRHSSPDESITQSKQQQKRWKKFVKSLKQMEITKK